VHPRALEDLASEDQQGECEQQGVEEQRGPDLEDLPAEVREKLDVVSVDELGEVLGPAIRGGSFRDGKLLFAEGDQEPRGGQPGVLQH